MPEVESKEKGAGLHPDLFRLFFDGRCCSQTKYSSAHPTKLIQVRKSGYRTLPGRENRAIAGLSMGSGIAANVGLKRLDVFASVGLLSAGMFRGAANAAPAGAALLDKISPGFLADPAATNKKLRLLFFSCGTEDPRITAMTQVAEELRSRKINITFKCYPGEHEWKVWRHSLADMAPMLFR